MPCTWKAPTCFQNSQNTEPPLTQTPKGNKMVWVSRGFKVVSIGCCFSCLILFYFGVTTHYIKFKSCNLPRFISTVNRSSSYKRAFQIHDYLSNIARLCFFFLLSRGCAVQYWWIILTGELYTFVNNGTLVSGQKAILLYVVGSNNPVRSGCHDYIS